MLDKHKFIKFKKCLPHVGGRVGTWAIFVKYIYVIFLFIDYEFMKICLSWKK